MTLSTVNVEHYQGSLLELSIENASLSGLFNLQKYTDNAIRRAGNNEHKKAFIADCVAHIQKRIAHFQRACWVKNLLDYTPKREGHWPPYTAGFTLSLNGKIWLTDNAPIPINRPDAEGIVYPCHRDLCSGKGDDATIYSGLYCYSAHNAPALFLYPDTVEALNAAMKTALCSLIGVHRITGETKVYANSPRRFLFTLKDG